VKSTVSENAFVLLNPGETVTVSLDLADHFDMTRVGNYHIEMVPSEQFDIQDRLALGRVAVARCRDFNMGLERRSLKYSICGIREDYKEEEPSQEEFRKNFIAITESPIQVHSVLTLDPTEEQFKGDKNDDVSKEIPLFGILGPVSLEINITSDNIPHKPDPNAKIPDSCDCKYTCNIFGVQTSYSSEEIEKSKEYRRRFEELECPGFSVLKMLKYRREIEDICWKIISYDFCERIMDEMEGAVKKADKLFNLFTSLYHKYII